MALKHLCSSCPSWDADDCAVLRKHSVYDDGGRVDEEPCPCSCHDEFLEGLFEEDYDERYEKCFCRFCHCMSQVEGGGECSECRSGAHQG